MEGTEGKQEQPEGAAVVDPRKMADHLASLQSMSREPFQFELATILSIPPSPEARQKFYDRFPDRRSQEMATIARLAGYSEAIKVTANFNFLVANMSDMELVKELDEANRRLDALEAKQGTRRKAIPEATTGGRPGEE